MIQQDLRGIKGYILGIVALVLALFIPFSYLILRLFRPLVAALLLGIIIPLVSLILGIIGLVKSSKHPITLAKTSTLLNILAIIISVILIILSLYIFIKSGGLISA